MSNFKLVPPLTKPSIPNIATTRQDHFSWYSVCYKQLPLLLLRLFSITIYNEGVVGAQRIRIVEQREMFFRAIVHEYLFCRKGCTHMFKNKRSTYKFFGRVLSPTLNDDTKILTETDTETFFTIPNFPKPIPRLFFRYQIFRNRNRYHQKIGKSFETEKFRNRNVNL